MIKDGVHYCDLCKSEKKIAHTNCFECGREICLKHGKAVKMFPEGKRWVGYLCADCLADLKEGKSKTTYCIPSLIYKEKKRKKVVHITSKGKEIIKKIEKK